MNCVVDIVVWYFEDFFVGVDDECLVDFDFIVFVFDDCNVFVVFFVENFVE